jgi:tripartite-type tricarboxylate transporter receptor subunit TctC
MARQLHQRVARWFGGGLLAGACGATAWAQAQDYPNRPVRMLVPMAAGAGTDIGARILATKLSEALLQQVVVDNRAGASGIIGAEIGARAAPDGYTLLIVTISHSVHPSLHKKLPYDLMRDLVPVTLLLQYPFLLNVHPALPVKTVNDLIALAKARPGQLDYASNGVGGGAYLGAELFKSMARINLTHVSYKSTAAAVTGTVAGETSVAFYSASASGAHVRSGRLRALAVTGLKRSPTFPALPTVAEAARLPGYEVTAWTGLVAPVGTPQPVVTRVQEELARILRTPDVKAKMADIDFEPVGNSPQAFGMFLRQQVAKWAKVLKEAGAQAR